MIDLLRRVLTLKVPPWVQSKFQTPFTTFFEDRSRTGVGTEHGMALVQVSSDHELQTFGNTLDCFDWERPLSVTAEHVDVWLRGVGPLLVACHCVTVADVDYCYECDESKINYGPNQLGTVSRPGEIASAVYNRVQVKHWLTPFLDLPMRVRLAKGDYQPVRFTGEGWDVFIPAFKTRDNAELDNAPVLR